MPTFEAYNLGSIGVVQDRPAHELPPEAWSTANNIRFQRTNAKRMEGHTQVFGTPSVAPSFVMNVPAGGSTFWIYASLTAAYVFESGVHTDITRAAGAYTAANGRDWQGTTLAGIPILNNGADVPQAWLALSAGTDLTNLANWPSTYRAKVIRAFGPYLIALNTTVSGVNQPHKVKTSHKADPGSVPSSWDHTNPAVDAVEFELTDAQAGEILDGLALGSFFIIYKRSSTHIMRFVGGANVWAADLLFDNSGILNKRCVCAIDNGTKHFVVTQDDLVIHGGSRDSKKSTAEETNRAAIFAEMDSSSYLNSFVFENSKQKEVWFCYPTTGHTIPNKAFIYNYGNGTQGFRDFDGLSADVGVVSDSSSDPWSTDVENWSEDVTPWSTAGRLAVVYGDPTNTKLFKLDDGLSFGGSTPIAVLERTGLAFVGKDRAGQPKADYTSRKLATRLWPKISGLSPVSVQVGAQEVLNGVVTWSSVKSFDPTSGDKYVDL